MTNLFQPGVSGNSQGRPKTAKSIRRDTLRTLRLSAGPLVDRAVAMALAGDSLAILGCMTLLASGYGEVPAKPAKSDVADVPIVG
ncbi:DUF5681 domain-containing protein [Paraburkholderia dipogonis]|uniref:DUF5681 domain-containing protein n=1 Tax=Paraburkholderia dipogonis TaxID=1211383 RepID=UPI0038BA2EB5